MAVKKFQLTHEDELRVISAGLITRRFSIELNGNRLGEIVNSATLAKSLSFGLSGGGKLVVSLDRGLFGGVDVVYNGKLQRGSASHGRSDWDRAFYVLMFLCVAHSVTGLVSHLYQPEMLLAAGVGLNTLLFGLILGLLGFNVYRLRRWSLIATMVLWALDSAVTVVALSHNMGTVIVGALIVKIYFFYVFVRAVMADQSELIS